MVQERKDHEIITDPREQEKLTELAEKTQKAISAQSEAAGKAIQALVGLFVSSAKDKLPHTLPSRIMIYRQAREDLAWPQVLTLEYNLYTNELVWTRWQGDEKTRQIENVYKGGPEDWLEYGSTVVNEVKYIMLGIKVGATSK